jgi:hypothetical protein
METLKAIENTGFGIWVRESGSIWSYPTIIFLHSLGLSILVGLNTALDLRLLGVARQLPLRPMEKLYPFMWAGFWINAVSGVALTIGDAATMLNNPIFYLKMAFIAVAVVTLARTRRVFGNPSVDDTAIPATAKVLAALSLICWTGAITAGRLTAYIGAGAGIKGG